MRCLFIAEDWPITPDSRGGMSPLIYGHLQLIIESGLDVNLVTLSREGYSKGFEEFKIDQKEIWGSIRKSLSSHQELKIGAISRKKAPFTALKAILAHFPGYTLIPDKKTKQALSEIVLRVMPEFIWAEDLLATMLAVQTPIQRPIVYSHNDWKWRIKQHRTTKKTQKWYDHIKYRLRRRQEEKLVQEVAGCVAASASEAEEIRPLNRNVFFLPTTYSSIPITNNISRDGDVRVVHLGGMQTTANRLGLERFLDVSWPLICQSLPCPPGLWVVGSLDGASNSLLLKLEQANATCMGFTEDLTTVLRPNDIHIIPWEYNTGTRTRIPLILNHHQVLLSTRAAAACLPELRHEQNCVLVGDLTQMADEVVNLVSDPLRRQRLAEAGRQSFERHYTREAIQPRFNQFLQNIIADG